VTIDSLAFEQWLRSIGVDSPRRVARESPRSIVVSKFGPGFAAHLHDVLDRLSGVFDGAAVGSGYELLATGQPAASRVATWHRATLELLAEAAAAGRVDAAERAEVEAGLDSVAALLDAVLWSAPTCGEAWQPGDSEREAFADALARMDDSNSLFTRYYGDFEGRPVENHCPGASAARLLLQQAWEVCAAPIAPRPA
jgi:hypothetical protein